MDVVLLLVGSMVLVRLVMSLHRSMSRVLRIEMRLAERHAARRLRRLSSGLHIDYK